MRFTRIVLAIALSGIAGLSVAQTPAGQKPQFEVASIKQAEFRNDSSFEGYAAGLGGPCASVPPRISGNRVTLPPLSLCGLIAAAYDLRDYRVSVPDWVKKQDRSLYYQIQATAPDASTPLTMERARQMLQSLLSDRFQLKANWEMKELPVYALVVGKNGPKLTLSAQGPCSKLLQGAKAAQPGKSGENLRIIAGMGDLAISCEREDTMDKLAEWLSRYTDRPVLNRTGIEGPQFYELQWAVNGLGTQPTAAAPSEGPSLFTAIQEQLGLRLDATKAPVEVLVVDFVQRPTEN